MGIGKRRKYVDRGYPSRSDNLFRDRGGFCCSTLIVLLLSGVVQAHPGRTDAKGGHNDRKSGGYHFHGGAVGGGGGSHSQASFQEPTYRTEARVQARTGFRSSTSLNARTTTPNSIGFGTASTEATVIPDYEVKERGSSSWGERLKIVFLSAHPRASRQHLELIARKETKTPYSVFYFLPNMDLNRPPWASCLQRRGEESRVRVFDERAK
jgi:hypothetical protein